MTVIVSPNRSEIGHLFLVSLEGEIDRHTLTHDDTMFSSSSHSKQGILDSGCLPSRNPEGTYSVVFFTTNSGYIPS